MSQSVSHSQSQPGEELSETHRTDSNSPSIHPLLPSHTYDHFRNNLSENMFVVLATIIKPSTSVWQRGVNQPWNRPQVWSRASDVNRRRRQCSPGSKVRKQFHCWGFPFISFHRGERTSLCLSSHNSLLLLLLAGPCTELTKTTVVVPFADLKIYFAHWLQPCLVYPLQNTSHPPIITKQHSPETLAIFRADASVGPEPCRSVGGSRTGLLSSSALGQHWA